MRRWSLSCTNISRRSCWPTEHSTTKASTKDERNTLPTSLQQQHGTAHSAGSHSVQTGPLIAAITANLLSAKLSPVLPGKEYTIWTVEMTRCSNRGQRLLLLCQAGPLNSAHYRGQSLANGSSSPAQLTHSSPGCCWNSPKMLLEFWQSKLLEWKDWHQVANYLWNTTFYWCAKWSNQSSAANTDNSIMMKISSSQCIFQSCKYICKLTFLYFHVENCLERKTSDWLNSSQTNLFFTEQYILKFRSTVSLLA